MAFSILQYWISIKFMAHKCIFTALGTIVSRNFEHSSISQKVRGNTGPRTVCTFKSVTVMFGLDMYLVSILNFPGLKMYKL